jgi:hypothetical protein
VYSFFSSVRSYVQRSFSRRSKSSSSSTSTTAVANAGSESDLAVVTLLLDDSGSTASLSPEEIARIKKLFDDGDECAVGIVLADGKFNPATDDNYALRSSFEHGHLRVAYMLLKDARVDASAGNNIALRVSCQFGVIELVDLLLNHACVDPTVECNFPLRIACAGGHCGVVRRLLALTGSSAVNPAANDNEALMVAASRGHASVVKQLLGCATVQPSVDDNAAIRAACFHGHVSVVELLLARADVDPCSRSNECLRGASQNGHVGVVAALLASGKVAASAESCAALWLAVKSPDATSGLLIMKQLVSQCDAAHKREAVTVAMRAACAAGESAIPVVNWLATTELFDPREDGWVGLATACANCHAEVARAVLALPGVGTPQFDWSALLCDASRRGDVGVLVVLFEQPSVQTDIHQHVTNMIQVCTVVACCCV